MNKKGGYIIITGASSGIGYETAILIANYAACLILVDKNFASLESLKTQIEKKGGIKVDCRTVDLSSIAEVKHLVEYIKKNYTQIDVLINNAGSVFNKFELTQEGIEKTIATNYISTVVLSGGLLTLFSTNGKILNVASDLYRYGDFDMTLFSNKPEPIKFSVQSIFSHPTFWVLCFLMGEYLIRSYATSKLFIVLYTKELATRNAQTSLEINAFHPGIIRTKIVSGKVTFLRKIFWFLLSAYKAEHPRKAAEKIVYWMCHKSSKPLSGKYFDGIKKIAEPNFIIKNNKVGKALWNETEKIITQRACAYTEWL